MENEMRKDFQINTKRSEWKTKRQVAKIEAANAKHEIELKAEAEIKRITDEAEAKILAVKEDAREKTIDQDIRLANVLLEISREQDAYEHEIRLYVATLPDTEQLISKVLKGGDR